MERPTHRGRGRRTPRGRPCSSWRGPRARILRAGLRFFRRACGSVLCNDSRAADTGCITGLVAPRTRRRRRSRTAGRATLWIVHYFYRACKCTVKTRRWSRTRRRTPPAAAWSAVLSGRSRTPPCPSRACACGRAPSSSPTCDRAGVWGTVRARASSVS